MVKKILIGLISLILMFLATNQILKKVYLEELGKEYYLYRTDFNVLKSRTDANLELIDILKISYDNEYIIASRIPYDKYLCGKDIYRKFNIREEYILIDKKNKQYYATFNYSKFKSFIEKLNINLSLAKKDKSLFDRRKHLYESSKNINMGQCKKISSYINFHQI